MKFSIIVPAYNVEGYIKECISSILKQNFEDYEIILVDDGSADNTSKICDNYAKNESRIRVTHIKNGGQANARNIGISMAKGEYILFLDSDDKACENCLFNLNQEIIMHPDKDIYFGTYMRFYDKIDRVIMQSFFFDETVVDNKTAESVLVDLLEKNSSIWSVFRHSFKRSFLEENGIKFDASYKSAEDCDFFIKAILAANSFHATRVPFCYYRIDRPGSTMTDLKEIVVVNNFEVSKKWYDYFRKEYCKSSGVCSKKLMHFFANMYCDSIAMIGALNSFDRKKLIYKINIEKDILHMVKGYKHEIAVLVYSVFGKKISCILLNKLYKLNRMLKQPY